MYMSNSEWCPLDVLDVLGDPIARVALPIAGRESVAVPDVAEKLDVSTPAVYRRTEPLVEANPRNGHRRIDRHDNEHEEYETKFDEVTFTTGRPTRRPRSENSAFRRCSTGCSRFRRSSCSG